MKSVSKIFVRFVHINAFNVDELERDYAAAGYCRYMLPLKTLCCQCQLISNMHLTQPFDAEHNSDMSLQTYLRKQNYLKVGTRITYNSYMHHYMG
jgi:hypothetical protein